MKRPVLYWASLFILGELTDMLFPIRYIGLFVIGMICCVTVIPIFFAKKKGVRMEKGIVLFGCMFFYALGVFNYHLCMGDVSRLERLDGQQVMICGTVLEVENSDDRCICRVMPKLIEPEDGRERMTIRRGIRVTLLEGSLEPGDVFAGTGRVSTFRKATNPGGFDERQYRFGRNEFVLVDDVKLSLVKKSRFALRKHLAGLREGLQEMFQAIFNEKDASTISAMVLGDRSRLDADLKKLYQKNGIAHLIAISGLHIAMLGGSVYRLLRKLVGGYRVPVLFGSLFIIGYGLMTGMSGATTRAMVMLLFRFGADCCGRCYDSLSAMSLALLIMLLTNPCQLSQAGFLMSFGAIVGISVVNPVWDELFREHPRVLDGFFVSVSVQLVLLPILLYFYYEIPVYGVFLNVIVVPLMGILLASALTAGLFGFCSCFAARLMAVPAKLIFAVYYCLCNLTQSFPFHTWCPGRPDKMQIVIYYLTLFFFVAFVRYPRPLKNAARKRLGWFCVLVGFAACILPFYMRTELTVCFFDVGQGDGIYIRTPYRHHILVDGGSSSRSVGKNVLVGGVGVHGGKTLDYVFVTHADRDHYSGIKELLQGEEVTIRNFVLPDIVNPDDAYNELLLLAKEHGCVLHKMKEGDVFLADGVRFTCLNPKPAIYPDKNSGSLVLYLQYGDFDMLLTGDMDRSVEERIVRDGILESGVDVLKVSHHGSDTASSEEFLRYIEPKASVVSVGAKNSYGHPHKEVLDRLRAYGGQVLRTDESGAVTVRVRDGSFSVEEFNSYRRKENDYGTKE